MEKVLVKAKSESPKFQDNLNHAFQKQLQALYKHIDKSSMTQWGIVPAFQPKLRSAVNKHDELVMQNSNAQIGYGEITKGHMTTFFGCMQNLSKYIMENAEIQKLLKYDPESYDLDSSSRFIDIGSGFGKPVFHAAMQTSIRKGFFKNQTKQGWIPFYRLQSFWH